MLLILFFFKGVGKFLNRKSEASQKRHIAYVRKKYLHHLSCFFIHTSPSSLCLSYSWLSFAMWLLLLLKMMMMMMMKKLLSIVSAITGENDKKKIEGTVVLMKKNVLDFNDFNAPVLDRVHELFGQGVSLQLVSAVHGDPGEFFFFLLLHVFDDGVVEVGGEEVDTVL